MCAGSKRVIRSAYVGSCLRVWTGVRRNKLGGGGGGRGAYKANVNINIKSIPDTKSELEPG
jgi:hypothetical protein